MCSHSRTSFKQRSPQDVLSERYVATGFKKLQRSNIPDASDGWISPCTWDTDLLSKLPPVFVANGGIGASFLLKCTYN